MDFFSSFPKVDGFKSFMVVVERFSKYLVFTPAPHECTTYVAAEIFLKNVVKYFRIPEDIVSDRDSWFTSKF